MYKINELNDDVFIDYATVAFGKNVREAYMHTLTREEKKVLLYVKWNQELDDDAFKTQFVFDDDTCSFNLGRHSETRIMNWISGAERRGIIKDESENEFEL